MNAKKILAMLVLMFALVLVLASCAVTVKDKHEFTSWTIQTPPTEEDSGVALGECVCGETEEVIIPALTDTEVWTKKITLATHTSKGIIAYTSIYGSVEFELDIIPHEWTYTLSTDPTEEAAGEAVRNCQCGASETVSVPALTDTSVWSLDSVEAPSHTALGEKVYSSALYGSVTVVLPMEEHQHGAWNMTEAPSATATGTAERECACGDKETVTVPALTDTTVWAANVTVPPSYNAAGLMTYTSEYGSVEAVIPKLVAPYDGKTYANLVFEGELEDSNKVIVAQDTWSNATLTLDENGFGFCTSYPYRGFTQITMVDPETGRINITIYDIISVDEEGNTLETPIPNYDSYTVYSGYVDFATGMIIRARNSAFDYVVLYTPYEADPSSDSAVASSWNGNAMAITYTVNGNAYNVFCSIDKAYFNVSFSGMTDSISADACYNAPYVYIRDAAGNLIASYGYDGEKQNVLDGYEGTYTNSENGDLFVSGFGTLTLGGLSGTYTVAAEGADYDLDVYLKDAEGNVTHFYLVVLGDDRTYTLSMPKVTVQFVTGEYATEEDAVYNKFVPQILPTYEHDTMTFKGWYYDAECTQPVASPFIPTEDVTLYAKWKEKVVITLVGTVGDDADTIYLGEGDVIGDFLPSYNLDLDNYKKFVAWYVDMNGNGEVDAEDVALDLETTIGANDSGATVIAKWEDLPAYYGTYYGVEIWNASYGNSTSRTLVIDENGNMSGLETGIIISYDPETQAVQWKTNAQATKINTFYFDAESGVIAGIYNDNDIANDYYFFSRYTQATNGKVDAHYGVKAPKTPGSSEFGYYAQFITAATKLGANSTIFLYNNHIYNNVTITTATGEPLTPATVKDAKTVIVTDNNTGDIIVAVSSIGSSFSANNTTKVLDAYFGIYTMGDETVTLDGTGIITYNGKTGKYTATENGFDVYFAESGKNTEYYVMTLDTVAKTCALVKPMANVTLDTDGVDADFAQIGEANINIAIELPTLTHENYVFRGWYVAGDESKTPVGETYVPTADVTLVAIWKVKYTLTVVYNDNATEDSVYVYGEGEVATVDDPTYAKHKFDGWFITAIFAEGSEWTSGAVITENVTIYAKWSDAPIYNLTYVTTELEKKNSGDATGLIDVYTRTSAVLNVDPNGKAPSTSYPFSGGSTITDYDPVAGTLVLNCGNNSYRGFIDKETGMILLNHESGNGDMKEFFLLNPFATNSIASFVTGSYWNDGMTACIVYAYSDEVTYTIFVNNNRVYFGVSFEDAEGNRIVDGEQCYQSSTLIVRDAEGNRIAYFAYDGTTMRELDGNEGTYTHPEMGDLVISGYSPLTMNGVNGSYTQNDNSTLDVLLHNADNAVIMYYIVTLDKENRTYTAATVPVTLTFVSDYGAAEAQNGYAYVPSTLPTLAQEGFVFRGWYVQGDEARTIVDASAFVTDKSVTLVAKWDPMISFTIVYGNTMESVTHYYGAGDTPVLVEPSYLNGKAFEGWYTDADCTVEYVSGPISENTTVYVNWMDAHPMFGSYTGSNVYGSATLGSTNTGGTSTLNIVIDAQGNVTGKTTGEIKDYNPVTGEFKLYTGTSNFLFGVYDAETGIMIFNYSSGGAVLSNDVYIYAPGTTFKCSKTEGCYWNSGKTKLGAIQCDAGVINYFMFDNRLYTNVTWTSDDGEVAAQNAYNASNLSVYDSEGNFIAYFAKESGKGLVYKVSDGLAGTYYTDAENNAMILNGFGAGTVTNEANGLSDATFTYTVMADDADYDLLLVIGDAYYKVTLADSTYTIEHIVYTLTFVTGIEGVTVDSVTVEHNADYRLPSDITAIGYKFEGWYTTPEYTERVYWSEENTNATYYAKWSVTCTVTLVYGGDIPNSNLSYNSGVTLSMGATLSADGASLYVWYTDEAHTQLFTSTTVTGNMTLYGVKVANITYGSYKFVDKNGSMVSNNKGANSSTASMTVTMLGNYSFTYKYVVSTERTYDKFSVSQTVGGNTSTPVSEASGEDEGTKTVAMAAGDSITFKYTKDVSGKSGDDCVTLTLTITPIA